jgi:hypothetical protein
MIAQSPSETSRRLYDAVLSENDGTGTITANKKPLLQLVTCMNKLHEHVLYHRDVEGHYKLLAQAHLDSNQF